MRGAKRDSSSPLTDKVALASKPSAIPFPFGEKTDVSGNSDQPRHDLYYAIHKGIRYAHCRLLMRIGSLDLDNDAARDALVSALRDHLNLCNGHLAHENREIHTALEARSPGASEVAEEGHVEHEKTFEELGRLIGTLATAAPGERQKVAHALYRRFALFMANDFEHMHEEETVLQPALQMAFTDEELLAIEHRIVASIPPHEMPLNMVPIVAAMHPGERREMLAGMKAGMPPADFAGMLDGLVKPNIPSTEWDALADLRA